MADIVSGKVSIAIDFQTMVDALQGDWFITKENSLQVTVDRAKCTFLDTGNSYELALVDGCLTMNGWVASEMHGSSVVWCLGDRILTWFRGSNDSAEQPKKRIKLNALGLTCRMSWGDPAQAKFTDAKVLACGGREFAAHRAVLAAASPVFEKLFSNPMRDGIEMKIDISDASDSVVEALLRFIYTGQLEPCHASRLLPLAHRYELLDLVSLCAKSLLDNLAAETVVDAIAALRPLIDCSDSAKRAWIKVKEAAGKNPEVLDKVFHSVKIDFPGNEA